MILNHEFYTTIANISKAISLVVFEVIILYRELPNVINWNIEGNVISEKGANKMIEDENFNVMLGESAFNFASPS